MCYFIVLVLCTRMSEYLLLLFPVKFLRHLHPVPRTPCIIMYNVHISLSCPIFILCLFNIMSNDHRRLCLLFISFIHYHANNHPLRPLSCVIIMDFVRSVSFYVLLFYSLIPSTIPSITIPAITRTTAAYWAFVSFSFRKILDRISDTML